MKKFILVFSLILSFIFNEALAQPATVGIPLSIGRDSCGTPRGSAFSVTASNDSVYFFNYSNATLSKSTILSSYVPRLRIGNTTYTSGGRNYRDRYRISAASISYNPKDKRLYYIWTNYSITPYRSYIWSWPPDTTFATSAAVPYNTGSSPGTAAPAAFLLDTVRSFLFDIGGVTFDNIGTTWQLEFGSTAPFSSRMRKLDFAAGTIDPIADTIDLIPGAGGRGDTLYNVDNGDITLMPNGQMYYVFDNKLFTPDYGSYGGSTRHINSTYIDSVKRPGAVNLVGLAFSDGDLISSYSPGCIYRRIDPITGDTNFVNYIYPSGKGVRSSDMTQITTGLGVAKRLVSVISTGVPKQYDVVYDVFVKNYGTTQITNLQVFDSLSKINGVANVSNVSISMQTIPPPPGIALNSSYNGVTDARLLQNTGQSLNNFPVDSTSFTIRINCRLSNIDTGVVYYNSAVGFANGYKNVALRDSSTNGSVPDLNQNDKPDDVGEGIPTPLLIALAGTKDGCATLTATLYSENFGTGTGLSSAVTGSYTTTYTGSTTQPIARNTYTITNNAKNADTTNFVSMTDHTGNVNGRMMVFNADAPPRVFFRDTMPTSCPGRQYSLTFWTAFPANSVYATACTALGGFRYPKVKMRMIDIVTGLDVVTLTTDSFYSPGWVQKGMRWTMPRGYSNLIMELSNNAPGGCGNDMVLDDIVYGTCDALPTVNTSGITGCLGDSVRFVGSLADSSVLPGPKDHQWQIASAAAGPWADIAGATLPTYTINPILPADTGKFYRLIVAAQGSISIPICRSTSPSVKLTGQVPSVAPISAGKNKNGSICPGIAVKIYRNGGRAGTGATWRWYTGSPGGTFIGTGDTLTVTPSVNTKYYVRAEGTCNTTTADSVVINISCDIDKDDDGIPDFVENSIITTATVTQAYNVAFAGYKDNSNDFINDDFQADGDSDNDGILNYLDTSFPGRVDTNSDNIDDRFDNDLDGIIDMLDLDSDNDGIPDVVEANGVDANGDGRIDNFTDTDGDGLSQNVDANNTGANNSNAGLGIINFDNDNVSNQFDLDSDNDGIPDVIEVDGSDTNNDGIIDGFVDTNNDGLHDSYINAIGLLRTGADVGGDGRADSYPNKNFDSDARPSAYDIDSDGDGILDVTEVGFNNPSFLGWVVDPYGADGWSDVIDTMAVLTLQNTDGRGNPNHLDIDSDDDGIPDQIEGQPTANPLPSGYMMPLGTDPDRDGLDTRWDNRPAIFGGTGIVPVNIDGDPFPDYIDLDTDADGQPDIVEGNDFNMNGWADDNVTLTLLDTDGDGLDNRFDSSYGVKGTSYNLSNGGYTAGDPAPGARCPVQRRLPANTDRDWRYSGSVLPIQILNFTGAQQNNTVNLNWSIITPQEIERFEIERSVNNSTYSKVGQINSIVPLNTQKAFTYPDDITNVNSDIIYYRLKVIAKSGEVKYSNVLVVRKSATKSSITVMPNPAKDFVQIRMYSDKQADVMLRLIDASGKLVLNQKQQVQKGNNTIQLNDLSKFSSGNYMLQLIVNGEATTHKIMLTQ
ncbi:MAG: T9SS type A sorting domain-containing protein [Ferruginibacter sp.]|nr:T9SS type A sorting domain-containing protein [Ferruginibacter sp.]